MQPPKVPKEDPISPISPIGPIRVPLSRLPAPKRNPDPDATTPAMTTANKITLARTGLIPVFVWLAWAYGRSFAGGQPIEPYRFGAIAIFLIAAFMDGLDGFVARQFHQQSRLGSILDPLADKGLVAAALIVLALSGWPQSLPFWFPCAVIGRDVVLAIGFTALTRLIDRVDVHPSPIGKLATVFQLTSILWVLFRIPRFLHALVIIAVSLTLISGTGYLLDGIRQLRLSVRSEK
jgi:cardiolipin synthase (CMP-forming)